MCYYRNEPEFWIGADIDLNRIRTKKRSGSNINRCRIRGLRAKPDPTLQRTTSLKGLSPRFVNYVHVDVLWVGLCTPYAKFIYCLAQFNLLILHRKHWRCVRIEFEVRFPTHNRLNRVLANTLSTLSGVQL